MDHLVRSALCQAGWELSPSTWRQPWPPPSNEHRDDTLAIIAARIEVLGARRVRVAIDGRTAAGKTTLGHELARVLAENGRVVLRASLDDFKRPWSERHLYDRTTGEGYYRNAYDFEAMTGLLLEPAAPTGSGQVALCSIDPITQINHSDDRVSMPHDGILIVDSVFAFRPELNDHWELRIWVEIDAELSVRRGTQRDAARDGAETAEALHRERYGAAEAIYITEVDPLALADVIVDNSDFNQPRLVRVRVRSRRVRTARRGHTACGRGRLVFGSAGRIRQARASSERSDQAAPQEVPRVAWRVVVQNAELRVADPFIEGQSLEVVGVDVSVFGAPVDGFAFRPAHQICTDSAAALAIGDPKMADEEPVPVGVADESSDQFIVHMRKYHELPVLLRRSDCAIPGNEPIDNDLPIFRARVLDNFELHLKSLNEAAGLRP